MFRGVIWVALLCLLAVSFSQAVAVDTSKLSVPTLNDSLGNLADEDSRVTYRAIKDQEVSSSKCTYCVGDGGIRSFYDSAKRFSHVVGAKDYPYDLIDKAYDRKWSEIADDYQKLIKDNMGIVVCVAFGILFTIIFPIVGICFGCCRCCGNCGGSRKTDGLARKGYGRPCLSVALLILTLFVLSGGALLLKANDAISDGLLSVREDIPNNMESLKDYFNETTKVIDTIATDDLEFTRSVVFRDLDNIGYIFGGAVRDNVRRELKPYLDKISTSVKTMDKALGNLKVVLPEINQLVNDLKDNIKDYATVMTKISTAYQTATSKPLPDINTKVDDTQLKAFDGATEINKVGNLTKKMEDSQTEIDNIPDKVQTDAIKPVKDLKVSIMDYTSSVNDNTDDLDFADKIDTDSIRDKIENFTDRVLPYDEYRKYGGQGIAAIILLISLLLLLGLIFGVCGSSSSTLPHQRGRLSNCGGNILMAAVVLTFLFGWLLMLITTFLFLVGTPSEDYMCVAFDDTSIVDKLINDYKLLGSVDGKGTYLGDKILDNPNKNMTISEVLAACKKNEAMYKAFRVNESNLFNISEILDYKSKFSVEDDISKINVDFSKIKILTPTLEKNLNDFNDSIQYDFNTYDTQINKNPTEDADRFLAQLEKDVNTAPVGQQPAIRKTIKDLETARDTEGKALNNSVNNLKDKMDELKATLKPAGQPSLSDEIRLMHAAMSELDANLEAAGNTSFDQGLDYFTGRVFGIVDRFIDRLLYALDHDIGKCSPVWNTYNTILNKSICGTFIASVNGFWFALGWSLFFLIPSIIVAVKLAKYLRTMKLDASAEAYLQSDPMEMKILPDVHGPPLFANKVAPYDQYQEQEKLKW